MNIRSDERFQCPHPVAADRQCARPEHHEGDCDPGLTIEGQTKDKRIYKCVFCGQGFASLDDFDKHVLCPSSA